ncbi:MAG: hypothetical protein JJT94_17285 [Bernardetiaceae bacterium]|nr:hypothetical protein [Bernardetiaceae bacterium]
MKKYFLFFPFIVIIFSCNQNEKMEEHYISYDGYDSVKLRYNKERIYLYRLKDNKSEYFLYGTQANHADSMLYKFYENGDTAVIAEYKNEVKHGKEISYRKAEEGGDIFSISNNYNNVPRGEQIYFHRNGKISHRTYLLPFRNNTTLGYIQYLYNYLEDGQLNVMHDSSFINYIDFSIDTISKSEIEKVSAIDVKFFDKCFVSGMDEGTAFSKDFWGFRLDSVQFITGDLGPFFELRDSSDMANAFKVHKATYLDKNKKYYQIRGRIDRREEVERCIRKGIEVDTIRGFVRGFVLEGSQVVSDTLHPFEHFLYIKD